MKTWLESGDKRYGEAPSFGKLMERMVELMVRINSLKFLIRVSEIRRFKNIFEAK